MSAILPVASVRGSKLKGPWKSHVIAISNIATAFVELKKTITLLSTGVLNVLTSIVAM